jgi:hypothetical protein
MARYFTDYTHVAPLSLLPQAVVALLLPRIAWLADTRILTCHCADCQDPHCSLLPAAGAYARGGAARGAGGR